MEVRENDFRMRSTPERGNLTETEARYLVLRAMAAASKDGRVPEPFQKEYRYLEAIAPAWLTGLGFSFDSVGRNMRDMPLGFRD